MENLYEEIRKSNWEDIVHVYLKDKPDSVAYILGTQFNILEDLNDSCIRNLVFLLEKLVRVNNRHAKLFLQGLENEKLFISAYERIKIGYEKEKWLREIIQSRPDLLPFLKDDFSKRFLIEKPIGIDTLEIIPDLHNEKLSYCLELWSDVVFIRNAGFTDHFALAKTIVFLVDRVKVEINVFSSGSFYLEHCNTKIRILGMYILQILAFKTTGKELKLLQPQDYSLDFIKDLSVDPQSEAKDEEMKEEANSVKNEFIPLESIDVESLGSFGDSDDESLTPLNDDVEREKKPVYLRQVIDLLKDEDPEKVEKGLLNVKDVLENANSCEISDYGLPLCTTLLFLPNDFDAESVNFEEIKRKVLEDLVGKIPKEILPFLSKEFYGKNLSIGQKSNVLSFIRNGDPLISVVCFLYPLNQMENYNFLIKFPQLLIKFVHVLTILVTKCHDLNLIRDFVDFLSSLQPLCNNISITKVLYSSIALVYSSVPKHFISENADLFNDWQVWITSMERIYEKEALYLQ
jgi:hypothetical protein